MKKSKLLTPLFGLATVAAVATPILTMTSCGDDWKANMYDDGDGDYYLENVTGKTNDVLTFRASVSSDESKKCVDAYFCLYTDTSSEFTNYEIQSFVVGNTTLTLGSEGVESKYWHNSENERYDCLLPSVPASGAHVDVTIKLTSDISENITANFGFDY